MKRICAAFAILLLTGLVAEAQEKRIYVNGVFCNKLWQAQMDFRRTREGIPKEVILAYLNQESVECKYASTVTYVFSDVRPLPDTDEKVGGSPAYFYEGVQVGIRTSDGKDHLFKKRGGPAIVYFVKPSPLTSQNVSARL